MEYKMGRDLHRGISKFKHEALGRNIDAARTTSLLTFSSFNIYSLKIKRQKGRKLFSNNVSIKYCLFHTTN